MSKKADTVEGKIAAILQQQSAKNDAAIKSYQKDFSKILDILLKSRYGIKVSDLDRIMENEKKDSTDIVSTKQNKTSTENSTNNGGYPHPEFRQNHSEM